MDLQPLRSQVPLSQTFLTCVLGRSLSPVLGVPGFRSLLMMSGNLFVANGTFWVHKGLIGVSRALQEWMRENEVSRMHEYANHGAIRAWHSADVCVSTVGVRHGDVLSVTAGSPACMGRGSSSALNCHLTGPGLQWCPLGETRGPVKQCCPVRTCHKLVSLRALHLPT